MTTGHIAAAHGWFPGSIQVLNLKGILISSAVFARLTSVIDKHTDRQTDHATWSVTIGHIYIHSTAMQPNKIGI